MFGKNLKYLRTKNAMSQHDLSKKINYNQTTIARWENNERKPTMKAIVTIANLFNVEIGDLLTIDLKNKNIPTNEWNIDNIKIRICGKISKDNIDFVNNFLIDKLNKQNIQK